jgi:RNA polymerase sigma-70 factor (ECF subfamily)
MRSSSPVSWLLTVVRNACTRMLRPFARARRSLGERVEDADATPSPGLDPVASLQRWRLVHAVHAAIATLERPYREVLVMRDLEGLDGEETCKALGITVATMKTRLHRVRLELRRELECVFRPSRSLVPQHRDHLGSVPVGAKRRSVSWVVSPCQRER